jgi:hypothetical protein
MRYELTDHEWAAIKPILEEIQACVVVERALRGWLDEFGWWLKLVDPF